MRLAAMVSLVVEQVGENLTPFLRERLARRGRVLQHAFEGGVIERPDVAREAIVLVGARERKRATILMENGVEAVRVIAFAGEALEPNAVGEQQMIERAVHALEEGADVAAVILFAQRKRRLVKPRVGPATVGGELFEVAFHGAAPLACARILSEFAPVLS